MLRSFSFQLFAILFGFGLTTAQPVLAATPTKCPAGSEPMELIGGQQNEYDGIYVKTKLNGKPITAVIDTGAEYSSVDFDFAKLNGVKFGARGTAEGLGGFSEWFEGPAVTVEFGGRAFALSQTQIWRLNELGSKIGVDLRFILGRDVLRQCNLRVNFDTKQVRLLDRTTTKHSAVKIPISNVPAQFNNGRFGKWVYPLVEVDTGGRDKARLILDTGQAQGLLIVDPVAERFFPANVKRTTALRGGLDGVTSIDLMILSQIKLGRSEARNIDLYITRGKNPPLTQSVGQIGLRVLSQFNFDIDIAGSAMWIGPRKSKVPELVRSTSGFQFDRTNSRWTVVHIMKNGPAEKAGWQKGDQLCSVDGEPISDAFNNSEKARWTIGQAGRKIELGTCDGKKRAVVLENFY